MEHVNSSNSVDRCFLLFSLVLKEWLTAPGDGAEPGFAFRLVSDQGSLSQWKNATVQCLSLPWVGEHVQSSPCLVFVLLTGFFFAADSKLAPPVPREFLVCVAALSTSPNRDGWSAMLGDKRNAVKKSQKQHWKAKWVQQNGDKGKFWDVEIKTVKKN